MKQNLFFATLISSFMLLSCDRTTLTEHRDITALVQSVSNLPTPPPAQSPTKIGENAITVTEDGIEYYCTETHYSFSNNMSEVIAFNPNAGTLYPGSLVQGKYIKDGILNSIGSFKRAPLTLTLENYGKSVVVEEPTNASVTSGVLDLVNQNSIPTIAKISYKQTEAYSMEQSLLELGADYAWTGGSVGPNFGITNSATKSTIVISFTQEYYTVSIEQPIEASDFFDRSVSAEDLKSRVTETNPLCYLSSVTYGRMLYAKITAEATYEELKAAVNASLVIGASGNISYSQSNILKNSSYEVYILGGDANDAIAAATGGMEGIVSYLNNGANFSVNSLGIPITYTVRHASDNTLVKLGNALEYTVNENCYYDPNAYTKFSLTIDYFDIIADCDDWGDGDFQYTIQIEDNNDILKTISITETAIVSSGASLNVNAGPYEFIIPNSAGKKLVIAGCLYEQNALGDWQNLCWNDVEFVYPFTEVTTTPQSFYQPIDYGSSCNSNLYFTINKVQ